MDLKTIILFKLDAVAVVAELLTLPAVLIIASLVSAIFAAEFILVFTITFEAICIVFWILIISLLNGPVTVLALPDTFPWTFPT